MNMNKKGSKHWKHHRISAVLLLPLVIWALSAAAKVINGVTSGAHETAYSSFATYFSCPSCIFFGIAFLAVAGYHAILGLEEIITDYVPQNKAGKVTKIIKIVFTAIIAVAIISLLTL